MADVAALGSARTQPGLTLLDLGAYPGLVASDEATATVDGELYDVPAAMWDRLDAIEAVEHGLYRRVVVALDDGREAVSYLFTGDRTWARPAGACWGLDRFHAERGDPSDGSP